MKKIILASSSKRRIEMMKSKGYEPIIMPADVDEKLPFDISPEAAVMYLAFKKAAFIDIMIKKNGFDVSNDSSNFNNEDYLIIAADTVVVYSNRIIGKPVDKEDAFKILSMLRSNCHHVLTGVCIIDNDETKTCFYDDTAVYFTDYSDEALTAYVDTSEPYDKAGGYAIQETFNKYIDHIDGNFDNVVGFPWYRIKPFL